MRRTIISIEDRDLEWVKRWARHNDTSMASVIRQAVQMLRRRVERSEPTFSSLLERTSGTWKGGDGLTWQRKIRDEWDERPA